MCEVKGSFLQVISPCGEVEGLVDAPGPPVCVVSIVRSGDILQVHRFGRSFLSDDQAHSRSCKVAIARYLCQKPCLTNSLEKHIHHFKEAVRSLQPGISVGKILIQVSSFPSVISQKWWELGKEGLDIILF